MKGTLVRLLTRSDPLDLLRALIDVFARTIEPVRPRRLRWTPLVRQLGWRFKRESHGIIAPC
jgi:hypothetical protein